MHQERRALHERRAPDADDGPALGAEPARRGAVAAGDLQLAAAADVSDERPRLHVGERPPEPRLEPTVAPLDLDDRVGRRPRHHLRRSEVMRLPKPSTWITSPSTTPPRLWSGGSVSSTIDGVSGPASDGAAPAASRPAAGAKTSRPWKVGLTGSRRKPAPRCGRLRAGRPRGQRQNAVVGTDEEAAARGDDQVGARAAHARVDDHHVDRPRGEKRRRLRQRHRAGRHVARRNTVRDVDQRRLRARAKAPRP